MKTNKKYLKAFVLSLGLAAGVLLPVSATAQNNGGGVFGYGARPNPEPQSNGMFNASSLIGFLIATEQFGSNTFGGYNIGTEQFGHDAPLGSGLFILTAAGAAYTLSKRKKNDKNTIKR